MASRFAKVSYLPPDSEDPDSILLQLGVKLGSVAIYMRKSGKVRIAGTDQAKETVLAAISAWTLPFGAGNPPVRGLDDSDVTVLDVAWLGGCGALKTHYARCAYTQNRSLVYWGQNWVLNDCHQRAASQGFGWALAVDLDEVLELGPNRTLADLARDPVDAHTFGSSAERPRPCGAPCAAGAAPPPLKPHCVRCGDCERCLRNRGRRKHLARLARVVGANIHFVAPRACAPPCRVRDHATTCAWLRHFGGRTDGCPRTYCARAPTWGGGS